MSSRIRVHIGRIVSVVSLTAVAVAIAAAPAMAGGPTPKWQGSRVCSYHDGRRLVLRPGRRGVHHRGAAGGPQRAPAGRHLGAPPPVAAVRDLRCGRRIVVGRRLGLAGSLSRAVARTTEALQSPSYGLPRPAASLAGAAGRSSPASERSSCGALLQTAHSPSAGCSVAGRVSWPGWTIRGCRTRRADAVESLRRRAGPDAASWSASFQAGRAPTRRALISTHWSRTCARPSRCGSKRANRHRLRVRRRAHDRSRLIVGQPAGPQAAAGRRLGACATSQSVLPHDRAGIYFG